MKRKGNGRMGIKNIYFAGEEKWYRLLDKIDAHIPIYKIVDPVDRVMPSFVLFLLAIIILLAFGSIFLLGPMNNYFQTYEAEFELKNPEGGIAARETIIVTRESGEVLEKETDEEGKAVFGGIKPGEEIRVDVNSEEGSFSETFYVEEGFSETIRLVAPSAPFETKTRTVILQNALNSRVMEEGLELSFYCENSGAIPEPSTITDDGDGVVEVTEPLNCEQLYVRPESENYEAKQYSIRSSQQTIQLIEYEPPKNEARVNVRDESGGPVTGTSFSVSLTGQNNYSERTGSGSRAIVDVAPGTYSVSVSDPEGNYGIATSTIDASSGDAEITINVSKTIKAIVSVNVKDGESGESIEGASVSLKNSGGMELARESTGADGNASFSLTDTGDYKVTAKKTGGVGEGYFSKTVELEDVAEDVETEMGLELITQEKAGRVKARVIDQDGEPVQNAKIMLKYAENDSIVELNEEKNYVISDINGYADFLAGKVKRSVFSYATKYPFSGISESKTIAIDSLNEFEVEMHIDSTTIAFDVEDSDGEGIDGTAEIFNNTGDSLTGLISVEQGLAERSIKAGRLIHAQAKAEGFEDYVTAPTKLWPESPLNLDIEMQEEINEPGIKLAGLYSENGVRVQGMNAGNDYYAKLLLSSDKEYNNASMHFRVGKENHLSNDYLEIEKIEGADIASEMRGVSYDPELGYEHDSENFTEGDSKWITVSWNGLPKGNREVKVWFSVKPETPPNEELQFFWRAKFGNVRVPESSTEKDFYADTYHSKTYFEGSDPECEEEFCFASDWLYSEEEGLYVQEPYEMNQVSPHTYHFQILNNSEFDYSAAQKPVEMMVEVVGNEDDEKALRINEYLIEDNKGEVISGTGQIPEKVTLNDFEKQTAVDVEMDIEGIKAGGEIIRVKLRAEGRIVFTKDISFSVLPNEELNASFEPTLIPSLVNTEIEVSVGDDEGEPVEGASLRLFAKEPGFEDLEIDSAQTNRLGTGFLNSGAFLKGTNVYIEVEKIGFARKTYEFTVSGKTVRVQPGTVVMEMNTVSKRDVKEKVTIKNLIEKDVELLDIVMDSGFEGLISEDAFASYFEQFEGEELEGGKEKEYELFRAKLNSSVTKESLQQSYSTEGKIILGFRVKNTNVIYDVEVPVRLNISSGTGTGEAACLALTKTTQSKVTQQGKVNFYFELTNACQADNTDIGLDSLSASTSSEFDGTAEITLESLTTGKSGRTALGTSERKILSNVEQNEKFAGTVTYIPSQSETGESVSLSVNIKGQYGGQKISTVPGSLDLGVDVINLRECVSITSDSSPVAYDSSTTFTIDASGCAGQEIDIQLCKDDARCSGGVEGGISLSSKSFTLEGESKIVEAYSPSLPGTYGISVHAREEGTGSFTYVGEAVVGFDEPDSKRFKLNKTDFTLIGNESQDAAKLTNEMLVETVTVKADMCVWGKESVDFDWAGALTGAMIGASLGSMIGGAFDGGSSPENDREETSEKADAAKAEDAPTKRTGDLKISEDQFGTRYEYSNGDSETRFDKSTQDELSGVEIEGYDYKVKNGTTRIGGEEYTVTGKYSDNHFIGDTEYLIVENNGETFRVTPDIGSDGTVTNNFTPVEQSLIGSSPDSLPEGSTLFNSTEYQNDGMLETVYENTYETPTGQKVTYTSKEPIEITTEAKAFAKDKIFSFSSEKAKGIAEKTLPVLSFAGGGSGAGWGALIGAVVGGVIMGLEGAYDCEDEDDTADFTDFVTFLQGDQMEVYNTTTEKNETKTIPSDAGHLGVKMGPGTDGSISASWDFEDADYSTKENVGIRLTNKGVNEAEAKYGVLTIQANEHIHGDYTHSDSDTEYDVVCQNANFANYWVGAEPDEGQCSGISETIYSQKYHIRTTTGMPQDNAPYTKKSSSCRIGSLSGSTGEDAVPRIKLNWDWGEISRDQCDYGNDDYIYCDAAQFGIELVKKLSDLDQFLERNPGLECPPDPVVENIESELDRYSTGMELVADGYIGVEDINVLVDSVADTTEVTISVDNKTGASLETNLTTSVKGEGEGAEEMVAETFPAGESQYTFEVNTPEWDGVYMATAVFNGPGGNRRAVTKAFMNTPDDESDCWAPASTKPQSGLPSLYYYLDQTSGVDYTGEIGDMDEMLDTIVFRAYLTKDNFSEDFKKDFKRYYKTEFLQEISADEKEVLEHFDEIEFSEKYTGEKEINPGLYYVWINADFDEDMQLFEGNTEIEVELLQIKNPSTSYPFYYIPFDGMLGEDDGRESYGSSYENTMDNYEDLILNDQTNLETYTFESASENGLVSVKTQKNDDLTSLTAAYSNRGQLLSVSSSGDSATIDFTPNYATPVMGKISGSSGTDALFGYTVEDGGITQTTGGNMAYWTGAAQSYDFYGAVAADSFDDTADYLLEDNSGVSEPGVTYGFEWDDITNDSELYLKTIFYTPTDSKYILESENSQTKFWTPNEGFSASADLRGLEGMKHNNYTAADSVRTVQDVLDLVREGKVCMTNDGSSMKFWWNPRIISITGGASGNSLEGAEESFISQ